MTYQRVLIIGIDGGTWQIFDHLIKRGIMPCLGKMKTEGCSGILKSTDPPLTPPAWTTLITGVNPDKHKVLDFEEFSFVTGKSGFTNSRSIAVETMWKYLGDRGLPIISLNMPMTYPPPPVNGAMVSGFGCPGMNCNFTWPHSLRKEIIKKIPHYDLTLAWDGTKQMNTLEQLRESVRKIKLRHKNELELVRLTNAKYNDWRLLALQIHTFDTFMHRGLKYATAEFLDSNPDYAHEVCDLFADMDRLFAGLIEYINPDKDLIIFASDHGHALLGDYKIMPNVLLQQWGYLSTRRTFKRMTSRLRKNINKVLHIARDGGDYTHISDRMKLDLRNTRAFCTYSQHQAGICFNMKNRWKHGIVAESEYESLFNELKHKFLELRHPESGEKLIDRVLTPQELYGSQAATDGSLGDMIVMPAKNYFFNNTIQGTDFVVPANPEGIKGFHHPDGMYLLYGCGVNAGQIVHADIADIAPTVYAALGQPIPGGLDGKPIKRAFDKLAVSYDGFINAAEPHDYTLSQEEEQALSQHLTNMGYL